jgi:hypothetical protein
MLFVQGRAERAIRAMRIERGIGCGQGGSRGDWLGKSGSAGELETRNSFERSKFTCVCANKVTLIQG